MENPFFRIKKGADNFTGKNLEFRVRGKNKPIAETEAKNTRFEEVKYVQESIDKSGDLKDKTDEELKEIIRNSIDNQYMPSSIYHKAKQELEFRNSSNRDNEKDKEILKLSPEFYGIGINLKSLWRKIKSFFIHYKV